MKSKFEEIGPIVVSLMTRFPGLSQKEIAHHLGVSDALVSRHARLFRKTWQEQWMAERAMSKTASP